MFAVYTRFIKDKSYTLIGYVIGAIAFMEMYIAMFPSIGGSAAEKLDVVLQTFPKEIWTVVGIDPSKLSFSHIESFLSTEQFSFVWPLLVIILAISLANSLVVADIEKGTIELALAQPVSRVKLFFSRYFAGLSIITVFTFITIYAAVPLVRLQNTPMDASKLMPMAVTGLLFALAIYAIASFSSAIFSEKGKATFLTTAIVLGTYVMNVIGGLKESLKDIQNFSLFHYYNATTNFVDGKYVENAAWFFLAVAVTFTVLAAFWFNTRDVSA